MSPIYLMKTTIVVALLLILAPAGTIRSQGGPNRKFIEVPFELIANQIVVEVKIAGKGPFSMLLDTDTNPSAIDLATAQALGLSIGAKGYPATGGGTDAAVVYAVRLPAVEMGDLSAKEVAAGAIDLSKLAGKMGRPIHGVLGYSFLKDRIVQIDYPASKLRFYVESPYPGIQNAPNMVNRVALVFRYDGEVLIDTVFINGQKMRATLDTGSSSTFVLTPEAVTMLALEKELENAQTGESVGYNGAYQSKMGVLKSVRIGRLSADSAQANFWLPGTGHDKKKFQVNIGNGFMKDYVVTFDFRARVVVFEKPE